MSFSNLHASLLRFPFLSSFIELLEHESGHSKDSDKTCEENDYSTGYIVRTPRLKEPLSLDHLHTLCNCDGSHSVTENGVEVVHHVPVSLGISFGQKK